MGKLLERALAAKATPSKEAREKAELAVAWAFGKLTLTEVTQALGSSTGNGTYSTLSRSLRDAAAFGMIQCVPPVRK